MALPPWAIVAGDFTPLGGMDRANYALAEYLARSGREVTLVAHEVWPDLLKLKGVRVELVNRPMGRHVLGRIGLARRGMAVAKDIARAGGIFLANGANCPAREYNWLHIVHRAYRAPLHGGILRQTRQRMMHRLDQRSELSILSKCKMVVCNSEKTRQDIIRYAGVVPERARVVYLGCDPETFRPISQQERIAARERIGLGSGTYCVCFVGQLQNSIKNFDTLYHAYKKCRESGVDAMLLVAGDDPGGLWKRVVEREGLTRNVKFMGRIRDIPAFLAAADLLVLPSRYDSYGLVAQEAILRGLPVIVSKAAGVAERLDSSAASYLLNDPESVDELAGLLRSCSAVPNGALQFVSTSERLRGWTWENMSKEIVRVIESDHLRRGLTCAS